MTITSITRWSVLAGGAALTLGLAAGCSASNGPSASPGALGLPTSTAGVGKNGSVDAKVCAAIANDVAAITKNVSTPATFPGQCAFGGGATTVSFNLNDPQHTDVTDVLGTTAHSISGVGDSAVWDDGGGQIVPTLGAWKGTISCLVQPDSDVDNDMVTHTGTMPFVKITDADGAVYAQKMGAICTDVFTAAG
jgi:hypothetical protein